MCYLMRETERETDTEREREEREREERERTEKYTTYGFGGEDDLALLGHCSSMSMKNSVFFSTRRK